MTRDIALEITRHSLKAEQARILAQELLRAQAEGIDTSAFEEGRRNLAAKYTPPRKPLTREELEIRDHAYEQRRRAKQARQLAKSRGADPVARIHPDELLTRSSGRCYLCQEPITDRHEIEHIIPLSTGGEHVDSNLAIACPPCNNRKADRIVSFDIATRRPQYRIAP